MARRLTLWHLVAEALVVAATLVALLTTGDGANTGIIENGLGSPSSVYAVVFIVLAAPALVVGLIDGALARRQGGIVRRAIRALAIVTFGALAALLVFVAAEGSCDGSCIDSPRGEILAGFAAATTAVGLEWLLAAIVAKAGVEQAGDPD
jgi:hypothetical protein